MKKILLALVALVALVAPARAVTTQIEVVVASIAVGGIFAVDSSGFQGDGECLVCLGTDPDTHYWSILSYAPEAGEDCEGDWGPAEGWAVKSCIPAAQNSKWKVLERLSAYCWVVEPCE